jgi:hypothetical protein
MWTGQSSGTIRRSPEDHQGRAGVPKARRGSPKGWKTKSFRFVFHPFGLVASGRQTGSARPIGIDPIDRAEVGDESDPCHPQNPCPEM